MSLLAASCLLPIRKKKVSYLYLFIILCHYLHNPFPETNMKPRASSIVSYVILIGMNRILEPPIYFNAFNIFFLPQSNLKSTLFANQFILHSPNLTPTSTDANLPFSSTSLTHLLLNPLPCPLKQLFSLLSGSL